MATQIDAQKIEDELQRRLNNRMDSVRALVKSRQAVADARDALSSAEDEDARQFQAALGAGWTVDELRTSGLPEPEKKLRVRKRTTRTKKAQETDPLAERAQQAVDQANQTVHTANEATKKAREELGTAD
ncbi:hypothetical protein [Rhodococcus sp. KRD162]|jgi:hypothetical protein|uniref:hypothetical protein n=1 Tax=Rhodococcus sp. KRD162 TaxID=2729725 RepID=UPI0019CFB357|nr:hypothetical protein [Rhodococcus sp. KRD162]